MYAQHALSKFPRRSTEPPGMLSALAKYGGGALYSVGNLLDIPNSMLRDVLTGNNPFDQLLSPLTHHDRATGREVLHNFNLASKESVARATARSLMSTRVSNGSK